MQTLRVGIDLTAIWRRQTGIFRYAAEVAKHLLLLQESEPHRRYVFFFAREIHPDFVAFQDSFDAVICPIRKLLGGSGGRFATYSKAGRELVQGGTAQVCRNVETKEACWSLREIS